MKSRNLKKSHGTYSLKNSLPSSDVKERKIQALRHGNYLITQLIEFANTKYEISFNIQQATAVFLGFVSRFAIECLSNYSNGTVLPAITGGSIKNTHIVASFIKTAENKNISLFEDIVNLVKGNMLANALLCEDLESQQQKFKNVTFYLDTPILLDILGLHGKQELNASSELLLLVKKLSGSFATFEHVIDETEKVILHCENNVENPSVTNRVLTHIREKNLHSSDIALIRNNLCKILRKNGIEIQRTPRYESSFQIDEKTFQAVLEASSKYANPNARTTDINSVRSIYVLRKNRRPRRLEEAKAVLITPNWRFAKEAYRFGQQYEESKEVSPVITEFSLGNIAWLKSPLETNDLPKLELMASCYAIMEPSHDFWGKFLVEVDKLQEDGKLSSDDHAFLRSNHRVSNELMDLTLGSEEDLTEGTILEIKERIIKSLTADKDEELKKKEQELQVERREKQKLILQNQFLINKINNFGVQVGKIVAIITGIIVSTLLIVGLLQPFILLVSLPRIISWICFGGSVLLVIMTVLNLICGITVKRICSQFSTRIAKRLSRLLLKIFGIHIVGEMYNYE